MRSSTWSWRATCPRRPPLTRETPLIVAKLLLLHKRAQLCGFRRILPASFRVEAPATGLLLALHATSSAVSDVAGE